jgi:hypothetical protein
MKALEVEKLLKEEGTEKLIERCIKSLLLLIIFIVMYCIVLYSNV